MDATVPSTYSFRRIIADDAGTPFAEFSQHSPSFHDRLFGGFSPYGIYLTRDAVEHMVPGNREKTVLEAFDAHGPAQIARDRSHAARGRKMAAAALIAINVLAFGSFGAIMKHDFQQAASFSPDRAVADMVTMPAKTETAAAAETRGAVRVTLKEVRQETCCGHHVDAWDRIPSVTTYAAKPVSRLNVMLVSADLR